MPSMVLKDEGLHDTDWNRYLNLHTARRSKAMHLVRYIFVMEHQLG
jgi:hypothetical protein